MFYSRKTIASLLALSVVLSGAQLTSAQLRVMTYNVTNYSSGRTADLQTALFGVYQGRTAKPDLFIGQEFLSASSVTAFLSIMNTAPGSSGNYAAATFVDGPDTDSALFYRSDKLVLDGVVVVAVGGVSPNHPRNIIRYDLHLAGYSTLGTRFSVYSTHMKAGSTTDDKARRLLEAQRIRTNAETLGRPFLIGGDFNIQSSTETSYVELTGTQTSNLGRFFDPIKTSGNWNNSTTLRFVHTQDPVTGFAGMDDRFDFLLLSDALINGQGFDYIGNPNVSYSTTTWNDPNHSYRAYGNDGLSNGGPLNVTTNAMVGPQIAQALINSTGGGSGHIPVLLDMKVPAKISAPVQINFGKIYLGDSISLPMFVTNSANVALWNAGGIDGLSYSMTASSGFSAPSGNFEAAAGITNNHNITMSGAVPGQKTGIITISSDDPDVPSYQVQLTGTVLPFRPIRGYERED